MCEMNASRERLAAVSKERDALRKLNEALEQKCAALADKCEILAKMDENRARNYGIVTAEYKDLQKERNELKRDYEALRAAYIETAKERDNARECLDRLTNPGPEEAPTRSDILDLAKRCVCGDREQDYGSPEQNFERIAEMWESYLVGKCTDADVCILPEDVAAMLALLKIARIASGHAKADNWVDLAGYAACGGEIEGRK